MIEPIAELFQTKEQHYHYFATLALANIATDLTTIPALMNTSVLRSLIRLSPFTLRHIRRQIMRVLHSIASYPTGIQIHFSEKKMCSS